MPSSSFPFEDRLPKRPFKKKKKRCLPLILSRKKREKKASSPFFGENLFRGACSEGKNFLQRRQTQDSPPPTRRRRDQLAAKSIPRFPQFFVTFQAIISKLFCHKKRKKKCLFFAHFIWRIACRRSVGGWTNLRKGMSAGKNEESWRERERGREGERERGKGTPPAPYATRAAEGFCMCTRTTCLLSVSRKKKLW